MTEKPSSFRIRDVQCIQLCTSDGTCKKYGYKCYVANAVDYKLSSDSYLPV